MAARARLQPAQPDRAAEPARLLRLPDAGLRRRRRLLPAGAQARRPRRPAAPEPRPDLRAAGRRSARPTRTGTASSTCSATRCRSRRRCPKYLDQLGLRVPESAGQQVRREGEVEQRHRLPPAGRRSCGPPTPRRWNGSSTCTSRPSGTSDARRTLEQMRKLRPGEPQYDLYELDLIEVKGLNDIEKLLTEIDRIRQRYPGDARVEERAVGMVGNVIPLMGNLCDQLTDQMTQGRRPDPQPAGLPDQLVGRPRGHARPASRSSRSCGGSPASACRWSTATSTGGSSATWPTTSIRRSKPAARWGRKMSTSGRA